MARSLPFLVFEKAVVNHAKALSRTPHQRGWSILNKYLAESTVWRYLNRNICAVYDYLRMTRNAAAAHPATGLKHLRFNWELKDGGDCSQEYQLKF